MESKEVIGTSRANVDWDTIQEEIQEIPPEYREARFYPLKHVVEIFSSPDPQALTADVSNIPCMAPIQGMHGALGQSHSIPESTISTRSRIQWLEPMHGPMS